MISAECLQGILGWSAGSAHVHSLEVPSLGLRISCRAANSQYLSEGFVSRTLYSGILSTEDFQLKCSFSRKKRETDDVGMGMNTDTLHSV